MPLYESTFIIRQDISQHDAESIADNFANIINDGGGKVIKREYWGLRTLAYKINKSKKGHYIFFGIDATSDVVTEVGRKARINEDVMRNLTIKVDDISNDPSPIIKADKD